MSTDPLNCVTIIIKNEPIRRPLPLTSLNPVTGTIFCGLIPGALGGSENEGRAEGGQMTRSDRIPNICDFSRLATKRLQRLDFLVRIGNWSALMGTASACCAVR